MDRGVNLNLIALNSHKLKPRSMIKIPKNGLCWKKKMLRCRNLFKIIGAIINQCKQKRRNKIQGFPLGLTGDDWPFSDALNFIISHVNDNKASFILFKFTCVLRNSNGYNRTVIRPIFSIKWGQYMVQSPTQKMKI